MFFPESQSRFSSPVQNRFGVGRTYRTDREKKDRKKTPPPELSTADAGMREEMCVCVCGRSTC